MSNDLEAFIEQVTGGDEPAAEVEVAPQEAEVKAEVEPEKQDSTPEPEVSESEEGDKWTKAQQAAVIAERRKRQELEKRLAEIEAAQREAPKRPDVFDDQDGAFNHVQQQLQSEMVNMRLEFAQEMMRDAHPDYDELEAEFIEMARENPVLQAELRNSRNPARYAYETARKARAAQELQNIDAYKEKLKAELRAELEAEIKASREAEESKLSKKRQAIQPSLTTVKGVQTHIEDEDDSLQALTRLG